MGVFTLPFFIVCSIIISVMPNGSHVNVAYQRTMLTLNSYTPHSIGFDETFKRLEALAGSGSNYPPYNVVNGDNDRTLLEIALAGFSREDIEVTTERNVLNVSVSKGSATEEKKYQHKGISYRSFSRSWQLADNVEVKDVTFVDGLLTIVLQKELPDKQKRKKWF